MLWALSAHQCWGTTNSCTSMLTLGHGTEWDFEGFPWLWCCPCYGQKKWGKCSFSCNKTQCTFTHSGGGSKAQVIINPVMDPALQKLSSSDSAAFFPHCLVSVRMDDLLGMLMMSKGSAAAATGSHHVIWHAAIKLLQQWEITFNTKSASWCYKSSQALPEVWLVNNYLCNKTSYSLEGFFFSKRKHTASSYKIYS